MTKEKLNCVYVVETWLQFQCVWHRWSAFTARGSAWADARKARENYHGFKFRVTKYVSTKP